MGDSREKLAAICPFTDTGVVGTWGGVCGLEPLLFSHSELPLTFLNVRFRLPIQLVDATHVLLLSPGVSIPACEASW